jgi:RND family efflux transporter MFP subunit
MIISETIAPDSETKLPAARLQGSRRLWIWGGLLALGIGLAVFEFGRHGGSADSAALPSVAVAKVNREDLRETLTVAAEFRPYEQVSLHAKVAGFLQSITVDVGDHVKQGQLLAQLDVPELKNDFEKDSAAFRASEEEVKRVEANYAEAHVASERLLAVAKDHPKLVAQQEVDDAQAKDRNAAGALGAARQHVEECTAAINRTKTMLSYTTITAPFDGVITRRYADPGALIQTGTSGTQVMPLVDIDQDSRLRLVFPVPESAVAHVQVGASVQVLVSSLHDNISGNVARFSGKVDRATRTMSTEVDVDNKDLRFKPGIYAEATLVLQEHKGAIAVPVEAVSVGIKPNVLVVNGSGLVEKRGVELGLQTPTRAEVVKGLQPGEQVIVGSRAGIQAGQKVIAKVITPTTAE